MIGSLINNWIERHTSMFSQTLHFYIKHYSLVPHIHLNEEVNCAQNN